MPVTYEEIVVALGKKLDSEALPLVVERRQNYGPQEMFTSGQVVRLASVTPSSSVEVCAWAATQFTRATEFSLECVRLLRDDEIIEKVNDTWEALPRFVVGDRCEAKGGPYGMRGVIRFVFRDDVNSSAEVAWDFLDDLHVAVDCVRVAFLHRVSDKQQLPPPDMAEVARWKRSRIEGIVEQVGFTAGGDLSDGCSATVIQAIEAAKKRVREGNSAAQLGVVYGSSLRASAKVDEAFTPDRRVENASDRVDAIAYANRMNRVKPMVDFEKSEFASRVVGVDHAKAGDGTIYTWVTKHRDPHVNREAFMLFAMADGGAEQRKAMIVAEWREDIAWRALRDAWAKADQEAWRKRAREMWSFLQMVRT